MSINYLPPSGEVITPEELRIFKAREVVCALKRLPFVRLLECRRIADQIQAEVVVFETEVEIGQINVHDIYRDERIAVIFDPADKMAPEVLALRDNFPRVPHLNLREQEFPRSLCLFEERYSELKLRWTAPRFIERIREWLTLTAKGKLHGEYQPLEPLLMGSPWQLVVPFDLFSNNSLEVPELLTIQPIDGGNNRITLIAERIESKSRDPNKPTYVATAIQCSPQTHGIIYKQPKNLLELHEFTTKARVDLLEELRKCLRDWQINKPHMDILDAKLIVILALPKTRGATSTVEVTDIWAFLSVNTIKEIGEEIGIWETKDGELGTLLEIDQTKQGNNVVILLLKPTYSFSRDIAIQLNGLSQREGRRIVAIGLGALGSQVFMNLIRMGYGEWTLIDEDYFLPHNLARHALPGFAVGYPKSEALAFIANELVKGEPIATGVVEDILNPKSTEKIQDTFREADVILDFSTSIAVARHLARDIDLSARRISMFLNPSGSDAVMLAEGATRDTTLDYLEMQYYRHLINNPAFEQHLRRSDTRIRYSNSCRDISSTIPQDLVALHAAICSRAMRTTLLDENCSIIIWQADTSDLSVKCNRVYPELIIKQKIGDWMLCTDQWLVNKIYNARADKLPNETGGVLVGSFDMQRKIVYVLDTLPSPPDSKEWPTVYIRGCQGLMMRMNEIHQITLGMLEYVGEWHSHPDDCGCWPSEDDRKAFMWLAENMIADGFPPLMLITGDRSQYAWYLGQML
ncbi:MAG: hypothetical protein A3G93_02095 [Nitrospinae bacterium RIFCSPLOWO2_12_FULL_45_22]|nr:MAG: hypothetical protein A3G93_02095 [Nitrospinae bacterium RIFCSPLOWO2_12_FULL_45_22]